MSYGNDEMILRTIKNKNDNEYNNNNYTNIVCLFVECSTLLKN